jgi:CRISPR-associated exonuclease Cas4
MSQPDWFLEVTDLKQYVCCPRIVCYRYCLPKIRPLTFLMEEGIRSHAEEEEREVRRSLRRYQIESGELFFHLPLQSNELGLVGRVDLAIATPSRADPQARGIVVEYKFSERQSATHFHLQLAAYALLLEECWNIPVVQGFLYSIPLRRVEPVALTPQLRKRVGQTAKQIRSLVEAEMMPSPPSSQRRCVTCEFRRFCNDVT